MFFRTVQVLYVMLVLCACSQTPDEQRVRSAIDAAVLAVESTDAGEFDDYLSEDFVGDNGRVEASDLVGLLRLQRLRGEHVGVLLGPITVEPRGDRLQANFSVTLTGGGRLLPNRAGVYQVESSWRLEDGDWKCYAASWKRAL